MKKKNGTLLLASFAALVIALSGCTSSPENSGQSDSSDVNSASNSSSPIQSDSESDEPVEAEITLANSSYLLIPRAGADSADLSPVVTENGTVVSDAEITYDVSNPEVVSVEDGKLKAIAAGTALVTASYEPATLNATAVAEVEVLGEATAEQVNSLDENYVNLFGRVYRSAEERMILDNVCTGVEVAFFGTKLSVNVSSSQKSQLRVFTDGDTEGETHILTGESQTVTVAEFPEEGLHIVRVLKAASPQYGTIQLGETAFECDGDFYCAPQKSDLKIEFVGDSITAGAGVLGPSTEPNQYVENSDPTKAYAYLTAQALDAEPSIMALEGICVKDSSICSYDVYTQTSTSNKTEYDPSLFEADIVVLGLGENDMWHATDNSFPYTVEQFRLDYADMLRLIRKYHPEAHIVCIYGMMGASATPLTQQTITAAIEDTGDNNISQLRMAPDTSGANYHPGQKAHQRFATLLSQHIRDYI